jgi:hypothetical protein
MFKVLSRTYQGPFLFVSVTIIFPFQRKHTLHFFTIHNLTMCPGHLRGVRRQNSARWWMKTKQLPRVSTATCSRRRRTSASCAPSWPTPTAAWTKSWSSLATRRPRSRPPPKSHRVRLPDCTCRRWQLSPAPTTATASRLQKRSRSPAAAAPTRHSTTKLPLHLSVSCQPLALKISFNAKAHFAI